MRKTEIKDMCCLGLFIMAFTLMAASSVIAQGGKPKPTQPSAKGTATAPIVDINNATEKQLEDLPGVGPATAKKIIAGRPYASVNDLAKAGVPKATITKITPLVNVGAAPAAPPPAPVQAVTKPVTAAATAAAAAPAKAAAEIPAAYTPPPAPGMVWVNLTSKVYHKQGDRWYGKTKNGKYMAEADAIKAGYRLAK